MGRLRRPVWLPSNGRSVPFMWDLFFVFVVVVCSYLAILIRYIPSEKIGQFFWPPRNGFFGINYHQWTWGNAFWPFLAPPDPWGVSGGVGGCQGGSVGPKFSTFCGATFGFQNVKFWIVWTENTLFSRFLAKNSPSGGQKWPFLAKMGVDKSAFFSKTPSLNCLKMHHNKVLGSILMWEKFGVTISWKIFHDGKIGFLARSDLLTGRK